MQSNQKSLEDIQANNWAVRTMSIAALIVITLIILAFKLWTPVTGPWKQQRIGQANFREAVHSRRIIVEQARGELAAAENQAAAIKAMGEAAKQYPEYRSQIFVQAFSRALSEGTISEIIYVPTETGLPITEAGRRGQ